MRWIWSDLHLSHNNIIKYENRPYKDINEMNKDIFNNWKTVVKKKDVIFCLGDVALGMNKEELTKNISNMSGKKILILGNHDRGRSLKWWKDVGFDEVYPYPIIIDDFFMLSHEPLYLNNNMPFINIHGHTHSNSFDSKQHVNVSLDVINFKPISLDEIINQHKEKMIMIDS